MKSGKILAIDYGSKRIGLASGDLEHKIAFPRDVLENKGNVFERIVGLCNELQVVLVVVGWPLSMKEEQQKNPILKGVRSFVNDLGRSGFRVELVDERLSSFEAAGKKLEKGPLDAHAAQIILQRYFDSQ